MMCLLFAVVYVVAVAENGRGLRKSKETTSTISYVWKDIFGILTMIRKKTDFSTLRLYIQHKQVPVCDDLS